MAGLGAYVLFMLFAGLRPQASFADQWVDFDPASRSTAFGHYGLMVGAIETRFGQALLQDSFDISMNVRLVDPPDNRFQILAQIGSRNSEDPLIIGQWRSSLIVMSGRDYRHEHALPRFSADLPDRIGTFADLLVTLTPDASRLLVDGRTVASGPAMPFNRAPDRISIGNAPDGNHGWTGNIRRLSLRSTLADGTSTRFELDKGASPDVGDSETGQRILSTPAPGHFPDRSTIGSMRLGELLHGNLRDVLVNLAGFMPFGFLLCLVLLSRPSYRSDTLGAIVARRATGTAASVGFAVATTLAGLVLSLAIETLQTRIPGRSPHVHDLILNTAGSAVGALCLLALFRLLHAGIITLPAAAPANRPDGPGSR